MTERSDSQGFSNTQYYPKSRIRSQEAKKRAGSREISFTTCRWNYHEISIPVIRQSFRAMDKRVGFVRENVDFFAEITLCVEFSLLNLPPGAKCALNWKTQFSQGKTQIVRPDAKSGLISFPVIETRSLFWCTASSLGTIQLAFLLDCLVLVSHCRRAVCGLLHACAYCLAQDWPVQDRAAQDCRPHRQMQSQLWYANRTD